MMKKYKKTTDNHMRVMGETDTVKRTMKINKKMAKKENQHKRTGHKNQVADTILHETLHMKHPKMLEKTVYKKTPKLLAKMGKIQKHRLYGSITG